MRSGARLRAAPVCHHKIYRQKLFWSRGLTGSRDASPLTTALTKVWNLEGPGRSIVVRATVRFFVRLLNPRPMRAARCRASPSPAPHPYTARATPTRHTARTHMLSRRMLLPSMSSAPEASSQSRSHPTASRHPPTLGAPHRCPALGLLGLLHPPATARRREPPGLRCGGLSKALDGSPVSSGSSARATYTRVIRRDSWAREGMDHAEMWQGATGRGGTCPTVRGKGMTSRMLPIAVA